MRGKVGLVIGLAAGYVLGTRAGRERYEQIKAQVDKVWNLDPVQEQVAKAKDFAKSDRDGAAEHPVGQRRQGHEGRDLEGTRPARSSTPRSRPASDQVDDVSAAAGTSAARREGCRGRRVRRHRERRRRARNGA